MAAAGNPTVRRLAIFTGVLCFFLLPLMLFMSGASIEGEEAVTQDCDTSGSGAAANVKQATAGNLTAEQKANAQIIVEEGVKAGVGIKGVTIALATAFQESGLRNLNYGDRDSLGLFQQRPVSGWGTPKEIRDPVLSARAFYGVAKHTNNPGLTDVEGWQDMQVTVAAQRVQASGYPTAYAKWTEASKKLAQQMVGSEENEDAPAAAAQINYTDTCESTSEVYASNGPVRMPLTGKYTYTSPMGMRTQPVTGEYRLHAGIDLATIPSGGPILAPKDGTVSSVNPNVPGAGNYLVIDHGGGLTTRYLHLASMSVEAGDKVKVGQTIGKEGNTTGGAGISTGVHLHFEVIKDGTPIDAAEWLKKNGVKVPEVGQTATVKSEKQSEQAAAQPAL